jgi:hypothetical protein
MLGAGMYSIDPPPPEPPELESPYGEGADGTFPPLPPAPITVTFTAFKPDGLVHVEVDVMVRIM